MIWVGYLFASAIWSFADSVIVPKLESLPGADEVVGFANWTYRGPDYLPHPIDLSVNKPPTPPVERYHLEEPCLKRFLQIGRLEKSSTDESKYGRTQLKDIESPMGIFFTSKHEVFYWKMPNEHFLDVWDRNGRRATVSLADGCLPVAGYPTNKLLTVPKRADVVAIISTNNINYDRAPFQDSFHQKVREECQAEQPRFRCFPSPSSEGRGRNSFMKRTHHCNELRPAHIGQTVTLSGWVHSRRDLGGLIFIDIRDREGRTQTVFDPSDLPKELFEQAAALAQRMRRQRHRQSAPSPRRHEQCQNSHRRSRSRRQALEVLNMAEVLPFPVDDPEVASKVNEELRLKYRYLDLRRPEMARNLRLRSKVATATRVFMDEQGFLEVETPTLFKSTPEGAREFLVPNRREPGTFYALPQSPQQFKQILMVAGVERYYPARPLLSRRRSARRPPAGVHAD